MAAAVKRRGHFDLLLALAERDAALGLGVTDRPEERALSLDKHWSIS